MGKNFFGFLIFSFFLSFFYKKIQGSIITSQVHWEKNKWQKLRYGFSRVHSAFYTLCVIVADNVISLSSDNLLILP